ncbi:MAG: hypothetical protein Q8P48_00020 [Deltaproteobacteria bacterium]|nr:hypothetical protein [Deltaproteobacteria bacterium]
MKTVKMRYAGNRPDMGHWGAGDVVLMPGSLADEFVSRGWAEEVARVKDPLTAPPAKGKGEKEVKANG